MFALQIGMSCPQRNDGVRRVCLCAWRLHHRIFVTIWGSKSTSSMPAKLFTGKLARRCFLCSAITKEAIVVATGAHLVNLLPSHFNFLYKYQKQKIVSALPFHVCCTGTQSVLPPPLPLPPALLKPSLGVGLNALHFAYFKLTVIV